MTSSPRPVWRVLSGLCLAAGLAWPAPVSAHEGQGHEAVPIEAISLEELLDQPVRGGEAGSFGYGLDPLGFTPYLHAYATFDAVAQQGHTAYFDIHYFNVFVGADLLGRVIPELQLELEHGHEVALRYAQVDVRLAPGLYARVGQFLVPFGAYNEYLYPEYLTKLPRNPAVLTFHSVVPTAWNDVGVQLRGHRAVGRRSGVDFAFYVSNGLEQADDPTTPEVEDGGDIREMRGNFEDTNSSAKAVGGRVSFEPIDGIAVGISGYSGAYTADGLERLSLVGAHAGLERRKLTLRAEWAAALQEAAGGDLTKWGVYARAAYLLTRWLEPAGGVDLVRLDGALEDDKLGILGAVNLYPYYDRVPTLVVRIAGVHYTDRGADPEDDLLMGQVGLGF